MRKRLIASLLLMAAATVASAAQIPRKSPEFAIQLPDKSEALVSQYRGKVLLLAFVLTT